MNQSFYQQFLQGKFINDLDEPNKPIAASARAVKYNPPKKMSDIGKFGHDVC